MLRDWRGRGSSPCPFTWLCLLTASRLSHCPHLYPPPLVGFFVNLNAVLLRLCGPFMDPSNANFWKRCGMREGGGRKEYGEG